MSVKIHDILGKYREILISDEVPSSSHVRRYHQDRCNGLGLFIGDGTSVPNVDFVRDLPNLQSLRLIGNILDDGAVFDVLTLRNLDIFDNASTAPLRLQHLIDLESLEVSWRPDGWTSLSSLRNLKSLIIGGWPGGALLLDSAELEFLRLDIKRRGSVSWEEISNSAPRIGELEVFSGKLWGVPARPLESLVKVVLDGVEVETLEFVLRLPALSELQLDNCRSIPSLRPLEAHPTLTTLTLGDSTFVTDGDLAPLFRLPALATVGLSRGRPNYTHKPSEVRRRFGGKTAM